MAEIRKKQKVEKYNIDDVKKDKKLKKESNTKKNVNNNVHNSKQKNIEKKSLWVRFRIFCHGVKSEFEKVHWPTKENLVKYSIATIFFIIFCSLFFYLIDVIFALIQSLF